MKSKFLSKINYRPELLKTFQNYNTKLLTQDISAGIVVGILALPLSIAFAIASGVAPQAGIITSIVAGFLISVFGGSKVQIGGPTGAFVIIVSGIIAQYGLTGLMISTMLAGVILVIMGICRLGSVIKYIPQPVIVGFTGGLALVIFTTQIEALLGLRLDSVPTDFFSK
jgi:SulP family sulfate permease